MTKKINLHSAAHELYFSVCLTYDQLLHVLGRQFMVPPRIFLLFVNNGTISVKTSTNQWLLTPAKIMMVRPHDEVTMFNPTEGVELRIMAFTPAVQDTILKQFGPPFFEYIRTRYVWEIDERTQHALRCFYDLYEYNFDSPVGVFSTEIANSLFSVFLQSFYQSVQPILTTHTDESHTLSVRTISNRFFRLLGENYKTQHTVGYYADQLCISSKYLNQIVKTLTNSTPKDLIDRRLGMESIFLLTKTEKNIQEISIDLGFPDQSYFGRFFKRLFGMSPLHYRSNPDMSLLEKLDNVTTSSSTEPLSHQ